MTYHVAVDGKQSGPLGEDEIRRRLASGEIKPADLLWREGWPSWQPVSAVFPEAAGANLQPGAVAAAAPPSLSAEPPKTAGAAIASLICGIAAFPFLIFPAGIAAVICGHIARSSVKVSRGALKGSGMALAGLILGYIAVAMIPVGLVAAIAIPAFMKVRMVSQEKAVQNNLRLFTTGAEQYMLETGTESASYDDVVGPGKNIEALTPVAGEDYTGLVWRYDDESISVTLGDGRVVEYQVYSPSSALPVPEDGALLAAAPG